MFQCEGRILERLPIGLAVSAIVLTLAAVAAGQEVRTVLETGDDVPRFGRIGTGGVILGGLDDRGRALVAGTVQPFETVWADGERFVPLLDPSAYDGFELDGWSLSAHPTGHVLGYGVRTSGGEWSKGLYKIVGGQLSEVVRIGSRDADGLTICDIYSKAINAAGTVAFVASVTPVVDGCNDYDDDNSSTRFYNALYLADDALRRVAGSDELSPPGWELAAVALFALTDGGEAVAIAFTYPRDEGATAASGRFTQRRPGTRPHMPTIRSAEQSVVAVSPTGVRVLFRVADADGPNQIGTGSDPYAFQLLTLNAAGDVVFRRRDGEAMALYRTAAGELRRLIAAGDPNPWGGEYTESDPYGSPTAFNTRGDLLMGDGTGQRLVLYPAEGTPQRLADRTWIGSLNERGEAAVIRPLTDASDEVIRYRNGVARRLAATGDRLPSGRTLTAYGLGAACMGPNGSVAVAAQDTQGEAALLCGDTRGFRPVSRMADPRPDGRRFYSFDGCAFTSPDSLVFAASGLVPAGRLRTYTRETAVYHATPQRLERLFGPGDRLEDGSTIRTVGPGWLSLLDADATGRVLAFVDTTDGDALVIAHADGRLARLPIRLRTYEGPGEIRFDQHSSVDHQYIAGLTSQPRRSSVGARMTAQARATKAAPSTRSTGFAGDPYYDPDAIWPYGAGLAASGGAFVYGTQPVFDEVGESYEERDVILHIGDDGVQRIDAGSDRNLPVPLRTLSNLRVNGDRIAYSAWEGAQSILTYRLGDAAPTEIVREGDVTPIAAVTYLEPLDVDGEGRVYFIGLSAIESQSTILVWDHGQIRVVGPSPSHQVPADGVSDAGAVLLSDADALRVIGPGPDGATCPHPPTVIPPPPPPTPTLRPGEPTPPPNVPFDPARCVSGTVCLTVGSAAAAPGTTVAIDVWLADGGSDVAGTQNDLNAPSIAQVLACRVNDAINKPQSVFRIEPDRTSTLVISLSNTAPIADGSTLYTCDVAIAADAEPGHYQLECLDAATSSPEGIALATTCADGILTVNEESTGNSPQLSESSGSGCAVASSSEPAWLLLLAMVAAFALRLMRKITM